MKFHTDSETGPQRRLGFMLPIPAMVLICSSFQQIFIECIPWLGTGLHFGDTAGDRPDKNKSDSK